MPAALAIAGNMQPRLRQKQRKNRAKAPRRRRQVHADGWTIFGTEGKRPQHCLLIYRLGDFSSCLRGMPSFAAAALNIALTSAEKIRLLRSHVRGACPCARKGLSLAKITDSAARSKVAIVPKHIETPPSPRPRWRPTRGLGAARYHSLCNPGTLTGRQFGSHARSTIFWCALGRVQGARSGLAARIFSTAV